MISPPKKESLHWSIGSIATHILLVNTGVRPVAEQVIQNYCVDECLKLVKKEGLQYIVFPDSETHTSIYMFKNSYLKHIINFSLNNPYNKNIVMHWIRGKMFGYSDEEIARFIEKNQ